jgi:hypothetical protein
MKFGLQSETASARIRSRRYGEALLRDHIDDDAERLLQIVAKSQHVQKTSTL